MPAKAILAVLTATATATAAAAVAVPVALPTAANAANAAPKPSRTEWREVFSPNGTIKRVQVTRQADESPAPFSAPRAAQVIPIEVNGPSASRFDLVFVGDGYTSSQFGTFSQHVQSKFNELMSVEPFKSHRKQFNAWQVNVASPESGVDNDPSNGVRRDTALDMGFWCGNTERLLCVNETKAKQYAAQAPDVDQVLALANSTKYGGAGGGVATASGGNASSGQIAVHELGHSIGGLADEYDYGSGQYTGSEVGEGNVSIYPRATMSQYRLKWYQWLGQATPDGGVIDTYEGARYYARGIYRPSQNSIMRTLGRQFNLPSREAMVAAFDRETGLIDSSTVLAGTAAAPSSPQRLWVRPISSPTVSTTWRVDGRPAGTGNELDLAGLHLAKGVHEVTATATDRTPSVRDPQLRAALTDTRTWTVTR
ncbi:hypothetical protein J4573_20570 [Actinomadura barringtoniae]|uniref:Peptidase M64 n=1 Tax=Actinomadura barringtoniae TaxID=1427535 RepID=A0A939PC70_9ACTN|nr:M64 family metallopeptidase [Actinomadura barringtoniae]MBO2449507.1 hypothetical protein [Actinomadura barringtoniae]